LLEHAFKGQILCMMIMNQVCKRIWFHVALVILGGIMRLL
jgi:hypothetical protein